jgi:hypothetical protein
MLIAMRLERPPSGYGRWVLKLLAEELTAKQRGVDWQFPVDNAR